MSLDPTTPETTVVLTTPPPEEIPIGFSTKVGSVVSAIFGFIALVTAVLHGDHSQETITSLILSGVALFIVLGGRYAQAALAQLARRW